MCKKPWTLRINTGIGALVVTVQRMDILRKDLNALYDNKLLSIINKGKIELAPSVMEYYKFSKAKVGGETAAAKG
jgi:hypothetical protein